MKNNPTAMIITASDIARILKVDRYVSSTNHVS